MKDLSIHVRAYPINSDIQLLYKFIGDEFDYEPLVQETQSGILYNCDKDITIQRPSKDCIEYFLHARECRLELKDTKGNSYYIGTREIPAIISVYNTLNAATLRIRCNMLTNPFL